jgi:hypothetical protein
VKTTLAASALLALAALAAPAAANADTQGTWWRVETVSIRTADQQAGSGANRYWLDHRRAGSLWLSKDGSGWTGARQLTPQPHSPQDTAAWKRDGAPLAPKLKDFDYAAKTDPGQIVKNTSGQEFGVLDGLTFTELQALPVQPAALKEKLRSLLVAKQATPAELDWEITGALADLLYKAPVPQPVKLAAFEAFKAQPGIQQLGTGTDALGRSGLKFVVKTADPEAFNEEFADDFGDAEPEGRGEGHLILKDSVSGKPCLPPAGLKDVKETKDTAGLKDVKETKDAKGLKDVKETKDTTGLKDVKETKDAKGLKDVKETKDTTGLKDVKEEAGLCPAPKPGTPAPATSKAATGSVDLAQEFIFDPKTVSLLASRLNVLKDGKPVPGRTVELLVKQAGWTSAKPVAPTSG